MKKAIIKFGCIEIKKQIFYQDKRPISIKNTDINKIVVSNKVSFHKYFIGYKDAKIIRPLHIFLPKMSAYRRYFHETKYVFLINNHELSEKYNNEIWEKV